jgi:hypothetical protein
MGITQTVPKSLVKPGKAYMIRGVNATEIIPQHMSNRNFTASETLQSVWADATPITTRVAAGNNTT